MRTLETNPCNTVTGNDSGARGSLVIIYRFYVRCMLTRNLNTPSAYQLFQSYLLIVDGFSAALLDAIRQHLIKRIESYAYELAELLVYVHYWLLLPR